MSLFDAFDGGAYQQANRRNQTAIQASVGLGGNALMTSTQAGLQYLLDGANPSATSALNSQFGQARQDVRDANTQAQNYLGAAVAGYDPLIAGGSGALSRFLDASGANGAEGSVRATNDFRASPGYKFGLDEALGAVQRSAAARGGLAGGNATADILRTATGLSDQQFQSYLGNLNNASQYYMQGVAGRASALGQQAQAAGQLGTQLGALGSQLGTAQAGVYGAGAGLQQNFGNQTVGMLNNATRSIVDSNNQQAQGQTQASANLLGAALGLGRSALSGFGGMGGFSGLFGGGVTPGFEVGDERDWR